MHHNDLTASCLAAAGIATTPSYPLDGRDLLPVLTGEAPTSERTLYWRMGNRQQRAVRRNDWKYLRMAEREFLFDLAYDPRERGNLAGKEPALLSVFTRRPVRRSTETQRLKPLKMPESAKSGLAHTVSDKAEAAYRRGDLFKKRRQLAAIASGC